MLFGTVNVMDFSFASTSSTLENQRLKLSALISGLSAADSRCHSCAHFLSIRKLLTVLHKCHTGRDQGRSHAVNARQSSCSRRRFRGVVEKICQKCVNTRQNRSTHRSLPFGHQSSAPAHLIVVSSSFPGCTFSRRDVFQKCSQLIHMRLRLPRQRA